MSRTIGGQTLRISTLYGVALLGSALALALATGALAQDDEYFVVEEALPFEPLEGLEDATQHWGVLDGAGYRIEIPKKWNRRLVLYAHGFRGTDPELTVSNPAIRRWLIENRYAWAASSYSRNNYDVRAGAIDTNKLAQHFHHRFGRSKRTYVHGHSMGGHVTGVVTEMFPNVECPRGLRGVGCRITARILGFLTGGQAYDGALPMCGVMGDAELFDYFASHGLLAKAILGIDAPQPDPLYLARVPGIRAAFSLNPGAGLNYPVFRSPAGETFRSALQQLSGGVRPTFQSGYDGGFLFWESISFLYQYGAGDGSIPGIEERVVVDTDHLVYQLDSDPALSPEEADLNASVQRVTADPDANRRMGLMLQPIPEISGRIAIPVLSLHTLGDLFVPFSMEQIYAREVAQHGRSQLLVQRAIRDTQHCGFSLAEQEQAFADLVDWVERRRKPAGDDVLDADVVADPDYGCTFTTPDRAGAPACP